MQRYPLTFSVPCRPRIFPDSLGACPYVPGNEHDDPEGTFVSLCKGITVKKHCLIACLAAAVLGVVVLSPVPATAASPNPASSCAGQLNQGATPHGLSESAPGFLGSFVSELAKAGGGAYGHVTSNLAGQHGDLFTCISNVPPLG